MSITVKQTSKPQTTLPAAKTITYPWQGVLRAYAESKDTHDMDAIRKVIALKLGHRK
jgi:hypothetical protein